MNFKEQFATVDLILNTDIETKSVDAFALSLIKAEKQMRRIFTFLIFQNPSYNISHYKQLRATLANNRNVYLEGFIRGIDIIMPRDLKAIYGEDYDGDIAKFVLYSRDRNKIFHGQITEQGLEREDLIDRVNDIKKWCEHLGVEIKKEIGYDGFSQSYKKSPIILTLNNLDRFDTIAKYSAFLEAEIRRR